MVFHHIEQRAIDAHGSRNGIIGYGARDRTRGGFIRIDLASENSINNESSKSQYYYTHSKTKQEHQP